MSKARTLLLSTGFVATMFGAPAMALAASEFHPASGEKGVTAHPSHRVLNNDRADVVAQRDAALGANQRSMPRGDAMGSAAPAPRSGAGLSRSKVEGDAVRANKAGNIPMGEAS